VLKDYYGVAPIIYTSGRVWHEDLNDIAAPDLVESPLWLTRYIRGYRQPFVRNAKAFDKGGIDPLVPRPWGRRIELVDPDSGDAGGCPAFSVG
jgi:hypothetical protein